MRKSPVPYVLHVVALLAFASFIYWGVTDNQPHVKTTEELQADAKRQYAEAYQKYNDLQGTLTKANRLQVLIKKSVLTDAEREEKEGLVAQIQATHPELLKTQTAAERVANDDRAKNNVKVVTSAFSRDGDYFYVRGKITNGSDRTLTYWEIKARFLDSNKKVVDTDITNDAASLQPGETKKWEIMHPYSHDIKRVETGLEEVTWAN